MEPATLAPVPLPSSAVPARVRPWSTTERNWMLALGIVVGSALLFWGVLAVESVLTGRPREERLIWHPAETSMRFLALSHFLVALVFMATSKRMRRADGWAWFAGLLGVGALLCWGFGALGGLAAPVAAALFYAYFLLHEFRDEAMFYGAYGDAPPRATTSARDVFMVPLFVFGAIAAMFVAGAAFEIGGARRYDAPLDGLAAPVRWAVGVLPIAALVALAWAFKRRQDRRHPGGLPQFLRRHRPILFVFVGIFAVLVADIVITGRVYAIVTLHVTVWYVFVLHMLANRPATGPRPRAFSWRWMRETATGFNVVHLGLLVVVVAAATVWAYAFRNDPDRDALRVLLSRESFPYWTIMHVTVSFIPK